MPVTRKPKTIKVNDEVPEIAFRLPTYAEHMDFIEGVQEAGSDPLKATSAARGMFTTCVIGWADPSEAKTTAEEMLSILTIAEVGAVTQAITDALSVAQEEKKN